MTWTGCSPATTWCRATTCFFSATGVTDGDVLQGVRYQGSLGASTESLVMRSRSGTVRRISARHDRAKMRAMGVDGRLSGHGATAPKLPILDWARSGWPASAGTRA